MAYRKIKEEFANWLALDKSTRQRNGLPETQSEFAEWKGVTAETLTRWKKDPEFQRKVESIKTDVARKVMPGSTVSNRVGDLRVSDHEGVHPQPPVPGEGTEDERPEGMSEAEWEYVRARGELVRRSLGGDLKALELYMRMYGKPFIEAEQQVSSPVEHLSDLDLAVEFVRLMGPDLVGEALVEVTTAGA